MASERRTVIDENCRAPFSNNQNYLLRIQQTFSQNETFRIFH